MKTQYQPRPFREQYGSREIQRDIDLMRAIYARRGPLNHKRSQCLIGWVGIGMGIGAIIAAFLIF